MSSTGRSAEAAGNGQNVLLVPNPDADESQSCLDLLHRDSPDNQFVLVVSYVDSPTEWAARWREHVGDLPAQLSFVSVYDATTGDSPTEADAGIPDSGMIEHVESPDDLTGLGIHITQCLSEWEGAKWETESPTELVFCFDSITLLFQYIGEERGFRFLHEITRNVTNVGAHAHYHLTAGAHDRETVATLSELFDDVVRIE